MGELAALDASFPAFPGAALVRVGSPRQNLGHTTTALNVTQLGQPCLPFCFQDHRLGYAACSGQVHLNSDPAKTDPVSFTPYKDQALFLAWADRLRTPTYLLFLCPDPHLPSSTLATDAPAVKPRTEMTLLHVVAGSLNMTTPPADEENEEAQHRADESWYEDYEDEEKEGEKEGSVESAVPESRERCVFLRFEGFLLLGHAREVLEQTSLSDCKRRCLELSEAPFVCASLMYWSRSRDCILNSVSRRSAPRFFTYETDADEPVMYLDLVCKLDEVMEL